MLSHYIFILNKIINNLIHFINFSSSMDLRAEPDQTGLYIRCLRRRSRSDHDLFGKKFHILIAVSRAQLHQRERTDPGIRPCLCYEYIVYLAPPQAGGRRRKLRAYSARRGRKRRKMPCSRPERRSLPAQDSSTITCTMAARTGGLLLLSAGT